VNLTHRRGAYGIDAPAWLTFLAGMAAGWIVIAAVLALLVGGWLAVAAALIAVYSVLSAAGYLYTTRAGKFAVWSELLAGLGLRGDERLLDMGCGRGAVLLMAARLLPAGSVVGVDLWKTADQSGNAADVTEANARREGVADRVELHTGDMTRLPFPDAAFDVVVSSMAIHNITDTEARLRAIDEAARVLRPGGKLLIADFRYTPDYAARLRAAGLTAVEERGLGWRFTYGGPWTAVRSVKAVKAE
jgi:arsenite methyltransferase